ncbi:hypothetical protein LX36DRAFT_660128 [Colletotrichum falcatum]|nr:hypothetical protein LX36DRAFT_660128 [Colletotrichum falcatum]
MTLVSKGGRFVLLRPSPTPTRWIGTRGRRAPWALLSHTANTASLPSTRPSSLASAVHFSTYPSRQSGMFGCACHSFSTKVHCIPLLRPGPRPAAWWVPSTEPDACVSARLGARFLLFADAADKDFWPR